MSSPIRLALIGLSSTAKTSWASGAHLPYLLSARGREKYKIVALLNSTVDAARRAVEAYELPDGANIKAYGDPQDLANDPDVDLVVNCTRVDVHYSSVYPSVKAGKSAYVEWPLAHDIEHVDDLANTAKASGSRTVVGLQGVFSPVIHKIREVLEKGTIGRILSTEIKVNGGTNHREFVTPGISYFVDRSIGGNVYKIGFAHILDQLQHVLGDFTNLKGQFQLQRPLVRTRDPATGEIGKALKSDVPDLVVLTGTLGDSNPLATKDGSVLYRFRRGQPFHGEPALVWYINGEKGEIRISSQGSTALHMQNDPKKVSIAVHDFETEELHEVEWDWEDWHKDLTPVGRSVAEVYEHFASDKAAELPTFQHAQKRHHQLEDLISGWKA